MDNIFRLYTIYKDPKDYPSKFVVRRFSILGGQSVPDRDPLFVGDTIEQARQALPPQADHCMGREEGDDPVIVETWI